MQLRVARLCLDCEEVHDQYQCPICASDHFTYISRWVPAPERRARARPPEAPPESVETYRRLVDPPPRRRGMFGRALVGLGAAGVVGLFLGGRQARARGAEPGSDGDGGPPAAP